MEVMVLTLYFLRLLQPAGVAAVNPQVYPVAQVVVLAVTKALLVVRGLLTKVLLVVQALQAIPLVAVVAVVLVLLEQTQPDQQAVAVEMVLHPLLLVHQYLVLVEAVVVVTAVLAEVVVLVAVQPVEQITEPLIREVEEVVVLAVVAAQAAPVS
jgi:hypothetical protein